MSFSLFVIITLFALGLKLGWPELKALGAKWRRRRRWIGSITPKPAAVKLYEDPQDLERLKHSLNPVSEPLSQAIKKHHQELPYQADRSPIEVDVRLCHIAEWVAEAIDRGQKSPSPSLIRSLCSHFGVSAPIPVIIHQRQSMIEGYGSFLIRYDEEIKRVFELKAPQIKVGVASREVNGEMLCVALLQPIYLSVNPFARQVVGDIGLIIHGETREMMPLEAWITLADGSAQVAPLQRDGSYFSLKLKNRARGAYQIEMIGESPFGPVVCLNASIYRSVNPPAELILTEVRATSRWAWLNRRRLYRLVNESRTFTGETPLPKSRELQKIAQLYAQEMSNQSFVSHTSPQGQRLSHRITSLQERAERILENLAAGASIEEVHEQLMSSPIHRAAILDSEVTHVGVGVSVNAGVVYGVEVFSLMNRPLHLTEDRVELYRLIQRMRREEGLVRLPHDAELERVAQRVALALVSGECKPHEATQHALHFIERDRQRRSQGQSRSSSRGGGESTLPIPQQSNARDLGSVEVHICQASRIERLPRQEMWLNSRVKSCGVGLSQGAAHEPYWIVSALRLQEVNASHLRAAQHSHKISHSLSLHETSLTSKDEP